MSYLLQGLLYLWCVSCSTTRSRLYRILKGTKMTDDNAIAALDRIAKQYPEEARTIRKALKKAEAFDRIIDECDAQMSHAEHKKKIAQMDYHTSEINHQEGRWHCANDLREFVEKTAANVTEEFMEE